MGCDIHGIFQAKKNGQWINLVSSYDQDRDYALFAWLGNVRNGSGFAGVKTHTELEPLTDFRGFPSDFVVDSECSHKVESCEFLPPYLRQYYTSEDDLNFWMGDHSHSWVSSEEVLNTKPPVITRTGVIDLDAFKSWDGKSSPKSWCGWTTGPNVNVCDQAEAHEMYIKRNNISHVSIDWVEDTAERFSCFIDEVKRLVDEHGEVRFVFGFDN